MRMENVEDIYPLSPVQHGMLFHTLYAPHTETYFEQMSCTLEGALDVTAFRRAWEAVVGRHPALRTAFAWEGLDQPLQIVRRDVSLPWHEYDWRELPADERTGRLEAMLGHDRRRGFDLTEAPLMRIHLIRTAERAWRFVWSHHHILLDGWSVSTVLGEVLAHYDALCSGRTVRVPPVRPYRDYIATLQDCDRVAATAFWRERLGGFTAASRLGIDRGAAAGGEPGDRFEEQSVVIDAELAGRVRNFARTHQLTLNTVLQGAFALALSRYCASRDVVYGVTVAGRPADLPGAEQMVGLFINTLPQRVKTGSADRVLPWLRRLQEQQVETTPYEATPLVEIQAASDVAAGRPMFETLFVLENFPAAAALGQERPDIAISDVRHFERTNYPLTFCVIPQPELFVRVAHDVDRFEPASVVRFLGHFQEALRQLTTDPQRCVSEIVLHTPDEWQRFVSDFNETSAWHPTNRCVHELFELQALRTPDAIALRHLGAELTYRDLNTRANRLAHFLRDRGVGPESLVGLCLPRGFDMVIGLLGVLKAGGAYVPLDPNAPSDRLAYMVQDAGPQLVLETEGGPEFAAIRFEEALEEPIAVPLINLVDCAHEIAGYPDYGPDSAVHPDNLAYVIYTSGSTGRPKGTLIPHRGLVNYLCWSARAYCLHDGEGTALHSPLVFDLTVTGLLAPLLSGRTVRLMPETAAVDLLAEAWDGFRDLSLIKITPAHLRLLGEQVATADAAGRTRAFVIGGEQLSAADVAFWRRHAPDTRLINEYGPTETVVGCCTFEVPPDATAEGAVPIGRPIDNMDLYLLDDDLQPVLPGVEGELYIGGIGLARGYLNRPELTAERFIPHPWSPSPGRRLYRTGDVARHLPDGNIAFVGRADRQIKIRGHRVEPGEIEARLRELPGVADAVVVVDAAGSAGARLVAYLQTSEPLPPTEDLRSSLGRVLPEYMLPAAFVPLEDFPLTAAGKVDREALPAPDTGRPRLAQDFAPPRNPTEEVVTSVWQSVLGIDRVGIHDDFFALGGHSLLATQVVTRLREAFQVEMPVRVLFDAPTPAKLGDAISSLQRTAAGVSIPPIRRVARDGELPLSFAQQRLWFLDQLEPGAAPYGIPLAVRLTGALDAEALRRSFSDVVRRHEALRTTFESVDGRPRQVIGPPFEVELPVRDLRQAPSAHRETEARQLIREHARRTFDLTAGPLFEAALLRLGDEEHVLVLNMHHVVSDAWSLGVLIRELAECYHAHITGRSADLPDLPVQYADFASWQRGWLDGGAMDDQLGYWKERLSHAPGALNLRTDHPRPAVQTFRGANHVIQLSKQVADALTALGREENATPFMVLLAAYNCLLGRYTGQDDLVVGTPIAGRNHAGIENLIGFFVNTLAIRTRLDGSGSFRDLLVRVRETMLEAYARQDIPFERLVEVLQPQRELDRSPLFQTMLIFQNAPMPAVEVAGLAMSPMDNQDETAKFDLTVECTPEPGGMKVLFNYNTDLFEPATIQRMARHFRQLLESIGQQPDVPTAELEMLSERERRRLLVEWNDTEASFTSDKCIHQVFEEQAARTPEAIALVHRGERMTYAELNRESNRLARHLRNLGAGPEKRVGVLVERSTRMVATLLGIWKTGAAYIPLDPSYPRARLEFMLRDTEVCAVVTESHLRDLLPSLDAPVVDLDGDAERITREDGENPAYACDPENLTYVIYTSGSTGKPKGVAPDHRVILNCIESMGAQIGINQRDVVMAIAPLVVDPSVMDIFMPLCVGARAAIVDREDVLDADALARAIEEHEGTVMNATPATWRMLLETDWPGREDFRMLSGGEALSRELASRLMERKGTLWNIYGLTETTLYSSMLRVTPGSGPIWIGPPIANTQYYVLDRNLVPVPVGVVGELHIGGAGLARGYLNRADLTAEKFIPDPFSAQRGARMFKTGDLVYRTPDGDIECLGRIDHQVKVRGFRIELGEVEAALGAHPAVVQAAVAAREHGAGDRRLAAYFTCQPERPVSNDDLRQWLRSRLPEYMVPATLVRLERMPLTHNDKIDRQALPQPDSVEAADREYIAPCGEQEERMAAIWSRLLKIERVGRHDNFFDLGGHSLLATQLVSRIRSTFEVELPLRALFETPTVAGLVEQVERAGQSGLEAAMIVGEVEEGSI